MKQKIKLYIRSFIKDKVKPWIKSFIKDEVKPWIKRKYSNYIRYKFKKITYVRKLFERINIWYDENYKGSRLFIWSFVWIFVFSYALQFEGIGYEVEKAKLFFFVLINLFIVFYGRVNVFLSSRGFIHKTRAAGYQNPYGWLLNFESFARLNITGYANRSFVFKSHMIYHSWSYKKRKIIHFIYSWLNLWFLWRRFKLWCLVIFRFGNYFVFSRKYLEKYWVWFVDIICFIGNVVDNGIMLVSYRYYILKEYMFYNRPINLVAEICYALFWVYLYGFTLKWAFIIFVSYYLIRGLDWTIWEWMNEDHEFYLLVGLDSGVGDLIENCCGYDRYTIWRTYRVDQKKLYTDGFFKYSSEEFPQYLPEKRITSYPLSKGVLLATEWRRNLFSDKGLYLPVNLFSDKYKFLSLLNQQEISQILTIGVTRMFIADIHLSEKKLSQCVPIFDEILISIKNTWKAADHKAVIKEYSELLDDFVEIWDILDSAADMGVRHYLYHEYEYKTGICRIKFSYYLEENVNLAVLPNLNKQIEKKLEKFIRKFYNLEMRYSILCVGHTSRIDERDFISFFFSTLYDQLNAGDVLLKEKNGTKLNKVFNRYLLSTYFRGSGRKEIELGAFLFKYVPVDLIRNRTRGPVIYMKEKW